MSNIQPTEGLEEILLELKKWCKGIGILTSNSPDNVMEFLTNHNLNIFDCSIIHHSNFIQTNRWK